MGRGMVDRKVVASGVYDALEVADADLRERMPAVFRRVDRLKSKPGWQPFQSTPKLTLDFSALRLLECSWCGDPFVHKIDPRSHAFPECCTLQCRLRLRRFRSRRARAA